MITAATIVAAAQNGFHWEGDFPLFIQGILMIVLSGLTLWLTLDGVRRQSQQDDAHEEHMAELVVKALHDQHLVDTDHEEEKR